jgi:hypothetical protein
MLASLQWCNVNVGVPTIIPSRVHAGPVQGQGQAEVADLGGAVGGEPHIARLQVSVDDALAVGELQPPADLAGDLHGPLQEDAPLRGFLQQALHVAAGHEGKDHEGLASFLAKIVDGHDVGMVAQAAHGPGLPGDALPGGLVQALGLDQSEGHVPVQDGVVGQEDLFLAALPQEFLDLVAPTGEGGGVWWGPRS